MIVKKEFHHGNLKNDALEKGLQIIKENGYENVEIKNIAKACGVSFPSIYRHFQSKNDLMMALFVKVSELFYSYLYCDEDLDKPPRDEIINMGIGFVRFSREYQHYYEFLFNSNFTNRVTYLKLESTKIDRSSDELWVFRT